MNNQSVLSATQPPQTHSVNDYLYGSGQNAPQDQASGASNGLMDFLPTLGGIAAPILGAALAPETGGLSLLASAALSGLGGAAGEAAKDVATGKQVGGDVLSSGIENAIGGGVGGVLGKLTGGIIGKIAPKFGSTANDLLMGQAPKGMLDQGTADVLRNNFGITNLSKATPTIEATTGTNGALNQGVVRGLQEAADNGTPADLSNLNSVARDLVSKNQMQLNENSIKQINKTLTGANINAVNPEDITQVSMKGGQVMNIPANKALQNVLPEDAFKIAKNFESLAQTARNAAYDKMGNVVNPDQLAKYNIFNGLAKEAEGSAFGGASPLTLSPENKAQIIQDLAPLKTVNPQAYTHLTTQLNNVGSLNDLRSLQSPLVQASKALNASQRMADVSGGKSLGQVLPMGLGAGGFSIGGPGGGLAGYALGKTLESQPAAEMGTSILGKLSNVLGSDKAQKVINTLTRSGTIVAANIPSMGAAPATVINGGQPNATPPQGGGQIMQPNAINSQDQLINALQAQDILAPSLYGSSAGGLLGALQPKLQQNQLLQATLSGLPQSFEGAGGAQGLGGIGSVLSGLIPGTTANVYQQRASAAAAQLAKTLGITPQEAMGMLPGLMQSPESAQGNLSVLGNLSGALGTF